MKSLLNITVFTSAVLSIFSTSLTLYEVPELKEALSVTKEERSVPELKSGKDMKRIYISHDVSSKRESKSEPLIVTKNNWKKSSPVEESINVFGVKVSKIKSNTNI